MNVSSLDRWRMFLEESRGAGALRPLSWRGFDAPAQLRRRVPLVDELRRFVSPSGGRLADERHLRVLSSSAVTAVARRLLLGGYHDDLRDLSRLWQAHGSPAEIVVRAAEAALLRAAWCEATTPGGAPSASERIDLPRRFVAALGTLEKADATGPLGAAVRGSRYQGAGQLDQPFLAGEARRPVGFPIRIGAVPETFEPAAWVWPTANDAWPWWLYGLDRETEREGAGTGAVAVRDAWHKLTALAREAANYPGLPAAGLPEWLLLYAQEYGLETLASAGLSLVMEALADREAWPLPALIGFTGRALVGDQPGRARLGGVTGLRAKLRAAREAGIFVLFACRDPEEPAPTAQEVAASGVRLIELEPDCELKAACRRINESCYDLGLTEYRGDWESRQVLARSAGGHRIASLSLPVAVQGCPRGFVGRSGSLAQLNHWKTTSPREGSRRRLLVIGGPRSGKTTLLARWLHDRQANGSRYPVWFSLLRHTPGCDRLTDLQDALLRQVTARHGVVLPPTRPSRPGVSDDPRARLERVLHATGAAVDVMVDGLDEAPAEDQAAIVDLLWGLPGRGDLIVGSQDVPAIDRVPSERLRLASQPHEDHEDALALIANYASEYRRYGDGVLATIGRQLDEPEWAEGLATRAGDNLWVLTHFLESFLEDPDAHAWPVRPQDAPLSGSVVEYCRRVVDQVLAGYAEVTDRDAVETLLHGLAVLENRTWAVADVLTLLDMTPRLTEWSRWRRLLAGHVRRLIATDDGLNVRFRDGTFAQHLLSGNPPFARDVARQLVGFLGAGGGTNETIRRYAAGNVARHVLRDGTGDPALARSLLLEGSWAADRFATLAGEGGSLQEYLQELSELERLAAGPGALATVQGLRSALIGWRWALDQTLTDRCRTALDGWWPILVPPDAPPGWTRAGTDPSPGAPRLLRPEQQGQLDLPAARPVRLTGLACELHLPDHPQPTLVLADAHGDLLVADHDTRGGGFTRTRLLPLGMRTIHSLHTLGASRVLVLADDWSGRTRLLAVDVASGLLTDYWTPPSSRDDPGESGRLVACAVLARPSGEIGRELVLVAQRLGPDNSRLLLLEDGQATGIRDDLPYREPLIEVYAPGRREWAISASPHVVFGGRGSRCNFQTLEGDAIRTLRKIDIRKRDPRAGIAGVAAIPGDRLALMTSLSADERGVALVLSAAPGYEAYPIRGPGFDADDVLGLHDGLGLLIANLDLGGIKAQPLEARAIADDVTDLIEEPIEDQAPDLPEHRRAVRGGLRLADGRFLIVYAAGGLLLDRDACRGVPVGSRNPLEEVDLLGVREDGRVLVGERVLHEPDFLMPMVDEDLEGVPFEHEDGTVEYVKLNVSMRIARCIPYYVSVPNLAALPVKDRAERWVKRVTAVYRQWRFVGPPTGSTATGWVKAEPPFPGTRPALYTIEDIRGQAPRLPDVLAGLDLGEEAVRCYCPVGEDYIAVGYESRRIEILRRLPGPPEVARPLAIGFTLLPPTGMAVARGPSGTYLAVSAGGVTWFNVAWLIGGSDPP